MARRGNNGDINVFDVQAALREQAAGPTGHTAHEIPSGTKLFGKAYPSIYRGLTIESSRRYPTYSYLSSIIPLENASYIGFGTSTSRSDLDDIKVNKDVIAVGTHLVPMLHKDQSLWDVVGRKHIPKLLAHEEKSTELDLPSDAEWITGKEHFERSLNHWKSLPSIGYDLRDSENHKLMSPEDLRNFPKSLTHAPGQWKEDPPFNPNTGGNRLIHVRHNFHVDDNNKITKHYAYEPQSERLTRLHHDDLEEMFKNS